SVFLLPMSLYSGVRSAVILLPRRLEAGDRSADKCFPRRQEAGDGSADKCSARRNEAEVYNSTGAFAHSGNTRKKWDGLDLKT
uniref:hypothetical protein n=1 Tax=Prevotella sp. TaxID=59823 RepID=UPI003FF09C98